MSFNLNIFFKSMFLPKLKEIMNNKNENLSKNAFSFLLKLNYLSDI